MKTRFIVPAVLASVLAVGITQARADDCGCAGRAPDSITQWVQVQHNHYYTEYVRQAVEDYRQVPVVVLENCGCQRTVLQWQAYTDYVTVPVQRYWTSNDWERRTYFAR